ncbi:MAG: hemerythrin family protein, partial [Pseudomonadota bacterium]
MALLCWKTEYSIGVMSVDEEHRELLDLINVLYERMDARSSRSEIETSLGDIHKAITIHFTHEEDLMSQSGYDEFEEHQRDHADLLEQLGSLMDEFARDPVAGSCRLQEQMSSWFLQHFAT